jgi:hypothetical protein
MRVTVDMIVGMVDFSAILAARFSRGQAPFDRAAWG